MITLVLLCCLLSAVVIHLAGMWLVARLGALRAEEIGLGIGPALLSFTVSTTLVTVRPLLVGGFLRFEEVPYAAKPTWFRCCLLLSGCALLWLSGLALARFAVDPITVVVSLMQVAVHPGSFGAEAIRSHVAAFRVQPVLALGSFFQAMALVNLLPIPTTNGGQVLLALWKHRLGYSPNRETALQWVGLIFVVWSLVAWAIAYARA